MMTPDSEDNLRRVISRRGMYIINDNLDGIFGLVSGFDAASNLVILKGFREWILDNYPQCNGPFGWERLVLQILEGQKSENSVDDFLVILTRFLDDRRMRGA